MNLQQRQKWTKHRKDVCVDDIVIIKDENLPRNNWQLARFSERRRTSSNSPTCIGKQPPRQQRKKSGRKKVPGESSSEFGPAYVKGRPRC